MRDGNKALQDWALVVVCLRHSVSEGHTLTDEATLSLGIQTQWWTGVYWAHIRCQIVCVCVFVQTHNHAEMWSKYTCIVFQGCTAALAGFPQHMPNRKHYRVCWVYRLTSPKHHHLFSVSLCCYIHFSSSTSLPSSDLNFHWRFILFPVSFSNSLQCLCLSHTPEPLKDNSFPGSDSHAAPPSHTLFPFPLTPFILPAEVAPNQWFSWDFPSQKGGGRSWPGADSHRLSWHPELD